MLLKNACLTGRMWLVGLLVCFFLPASSGSGLVESLDLEQAVNQDLVWRESPQAWHQQTARIVDHRFTTFAELLSFARGARRAGVSVLMLVQLQASSACPGSWYNGLQLCDHINGSYPIEDGSLKEWQDMLAEIKPMRLMVWWNVDYWSVQGEVWKQAVADQTSDVGRFFSYGPNATSIKGCYGTNPCFTSGSTGEHMCAQGSWGSTGQGSGVQSALSSFGSPTYAAYLADAMANTWTRNLGIDGYTIDCSANYDGCMLQTKNAQSDFYNGIVGKVRETQPHVVMSGEGYGSWNEVIGTNSQMGGQGFEQYHTAMQNAVFDGDASDLESIVRSSGADAATAVCYLHPDLDGRQPGDCPTMYFRDATATIRDLAQHQLWVALEAGSGIVSEHDFDPTSVCRTDGPHPFNGCGGGTGAWWNVTNDPSSDGNTESPLWAFTRYRALNRLALRTKLNITNRTLTSRNVPRASENYITYPKENCYNGHGGVEIGTPAYGVDADGCMGLCDTDGECDCVTYEASSKTCWKRASCKPAQFEQDAATAPYTVYVKKNGPKPPPKAAGGALAYLKHDSLGPHGDACVMIFNPGAAQTVVVDLSLLPPAITSAGIVPIDLLTNTSAPSPLSQSWAVEMGAGEARAYAGFSLGVYAPRKGKVSACKSNYSRAVPAVTTLQNCFLTCSQDPQCANVLVHGQLPAYLEAPGPMSCTLLGSVSDPSAMCTPADTEACAQTKTEVKHGKDSSKCATLVRQMPQGRPGL